MPPRRRLRGIWLGERPYAAVYDLQTRLQQARRSGETGDTLLLLEHAPVITLGRGGDWANLLAGSGLLEAKGVDVVKTDRGGDITLHAPGQLVVYPILDLEPDRRDVRRYVRDLGEVMRRLAERHGVSAGPVEGMVGLWTDARNPKRWHGRRNAAQLAKLGAIGVRISRWVTMHGFALNLTTDLSLFDLIVPCGIREHSVTSIQALTGATPATLDEAASALDLFGEIFDADVAPLEDAASAPLSTAAA